MNDLEYTIRFSKTLANKFRADLFVNRKKRGFKVLMDWWEDYSPYNVLEECMNKAIRLIVNSDVKLKNLINIENLAVFGNQTAYDLIMSLVHMNKIKLEGNSNIDMFDFIDELINNIYGLEQVVDVMFYMKSDTDKETFKEEMIEDMLLDLKEEDSDIADKLEEYLKENIVVSDVEKDTIYCIRYLDQNGVLANEVKLLIFAWLQGCGSDRFDLISVPRYFTDEIITLVNESIKSKLKGE